MNSPIPALNMFVLERSAFDRRLDLTSRVRFGGSDGVNVERARLQTVPDPLAAWSPLGASVPVRPVKAAEPPALPEPLFGRPDFQAILRAYHALRSTVLSWPGVVSGPYLCGGEGLTFGSMTFAHWHPCGVLGALCDAGERERLIAKGLARKHYLFPQSNWVSFTLDTHEDLAFAQCVITHAYEGRRAALSREVRR